MVLTSAQSRRRWFLPVVLIFALLAGVISVSAQGTIPITLGENQTGQITNAAIPVSYSVSVAAPLSIQVQILAITNGLAPSFRVIDPSGIVSTVAPNNGTQTIVQSPVNLPAPGTYTIEISSATGLTGQFLISVQAGAPLAPPVPITPNVPVNGALNAQTTRLAYAFSGSQTDLLLLTVRSNTPNAGPVVALRDADTSDTLAMNSSRLAGIVYRIGVGLGNYIVEVSYSGTLPQESFVICLASETNSAGCPGFAGAQVVQATPLPTISIPTLIPTSVAPPTFAPPTINPAGPCQVVTRGQFVNVRSGPDTTFSVVTQLSPTGIAAVIGRLPDNSWFQVNVNGSIGWVSAAVVTLGGNCAGVSVVIPPTVAGPSATVIPPLATTEVSPLTATATSTSTATNTLTATSTSTPTNTVTASVLNFNQSPTYGSRTLISGFLPDPSNQSITSGGIVNVSYLGGNCRGFAAVAPDFRIQYTSGAFTTLRFYFTGSADTTMIINAPNAAWYCADDVYGFNPSIDFNSPSSGQYDIWIGSYVSGTNTTGTLSVTENTANHP